MIKELERARDAKRAARRLWSEYQALIPMAASPRMDGMPRAGGGSDRNAEIVDMRDEAYSRYMGAMMAAEEAEKVARGVMERLPPNLYSLCLFFYLGDMKNEDVMEVMSISESTLKRYKADLREIDTRVTLA